VTNILDDIGGALLEPLEDAERILGEVSDKVGEALAAGGTAAGAELSEVGAALDRLADKVEALQQRLRGGGQ
jgi:hypothetical protein